MSATVEVKSPAGWRIRPDAFCRHVCAHSGVAVEVAPIGRLIDAPEASSANRPGGFSLLEMMMVVVSSKLSALSRQLSASLPIYGQPYPRFPLDKRLDLW